MRWCLTLGIVLAALIGATVKVARRPRTVAAAHAEAADGSETLSELTPSAPRLSAPPLRQWRAAPARSAAGQLFGRVLPPPGEETSFDALTVVADSGARTIEARVFPDGRFTIHLPAGQYAVTATLSNWIGTAPSVGARPDHGREVTIQLGESSVIRGHVRGPDGVAITVGASLAGHGERQDTTPDDDGQFTLPRLGPGRVYDLTFTGPGLRTTTLRSVRAPADGVEAVVVALPILRGAVGFPAGEHCPITRVALYNPSALSSSDPDDGHDQRGNCHNDGNDAEEESDLDEDNVDETCRFELPVPDGPTGMILVASGAGWRLEEPVSIPPLGDPDPICLNPPCWAESLEKAAEHETTGETTIEEEFVVR
jgi:hypothetical protein